MAPAFPVENPLLPPCPPTPNCVLEAHPYPVEAEALLPMAREALKALKPREFAPEGPILHAVYRIGPFLDDVHVAIEATDDGSILHVRSTSRVGRSDLGVNARRVRRYLAQIDRQLQAATG
jgi:uncharacterized protein (DUF1499 family)